MAKFMVVCSKVSGSVFVKEKDFFISQNGHTEPWGKDWVELEADSIEDARKKGCAMFDWARSYERQAK